LHTIARPSPLTIARNRSTSAGTSVEGERTAIDAMPCNSGIGVLIGWGGDLGIGLFLAFEDICLRADIIPDVRRIRFKELRDIVGCLLEGYVELSDEISATHLAKLPKLRGDKFLPTILKPAAHLRLPSRHGAQSPCTSRGMSSPQRSHSPGKPTGTFARAFARLLRR